MLAHLSGPRTVAGVAALDDLLARIEDEALRNALERELAPLRDERELGLAFERHLREKVRLPGLSIRRGTSEMTESRKDPARDTVSLAALLTFGGFCTATSFWMADTVGLLAGCATLVVCAVAVKLVADGLDACG